MLNARRFAEQARQIHERVPPILARWGLSPEFSRWRLTCAAGLLTTSAPLGRAGNTVLIGRNNARGEIFAHLADLPFNPC